MTKRTPKGGRRALWFAAGIGLVVGALAKVFGFSSAPVEKPKESSAGYQIKDDQVVWYALDTGSRVFATIVTLGMAANSSKVRGQVLVGADPTTFRKLGDQHGRDQTHVWYQASLIEGADPESFVVLDHGFSHDMTQVWQGATPVLQLDAEAKDIKAHTERILTVGTKTWLMGGSPPLELPESPNSPPEHYCRDWFIMNEALWWGQRRVLDLDGPTKVVDCDGNIKTRFEDGEPAEDLSDNEGILLHDGPRIWRVEINAEPVIIATLPDPIVETRLFREAYKRDPMLMAHTTRKTVFVLPLKPEAEAQSLGSFDALPTADEITLDEGFWLEARYFTLATERALGDPLVTDHGRAKRFGDMVLAEGALLHGNRVVARPGDLPIRQVARGTVLVGPSCLNFGRFATDVPDPKAPADQLLPLCDTMHPRNHILYEGLRIGFVSRLIELGPLAEQPHLTDFELGEVYIENIGAQAKDLPATFLEGFELKVGNTTISPPADAWPKRGIQLAPGQRHAWQLKAHTDRDPHEWGWSLNMRHSVERTAIFGEDRVNVGRGRFGE